MPEGSETGFGFGSFASQNFGRWLDYDSATSSVSENGLGAGGFGSQFFGGAEADIEPLPSSAQPLGVGHGGTGHQPIGGVFFTENDHIPLVPDDIYPSIFPFEESEVAKTRLENLLKPPFQGEPHWDGLLEVLAGHYGALDQALEHTLATKYITLASGRSLNIIGDFAGVYRRPGELDAQYRTRIMTEMRKHISGGTLPEILDITAEILGVDVESIDTETNPRVEPARFDIIISDDMIERAPLTQEQLTEELDEISAAGVRPVIQTGGTFEHRSQDHYDEDPTDEEHGDERGYNAGQYAGTYSL